MTITRLTEQGKYLKYAILSTKASKVLKDLKNGKKLNKEHKKVLERGANLISMIIEGASLSEGNFKEGLAPTQESLSVFGYALSALDGFVPEPEIDNGYTSFFKNLYKELRKNISKSSGNKEKIILLIKFFDTLGYFFRREVQKERYWSPDDSIITIKEKSLNDYRTEAIS